MANGALDPCRTAVPFWGQTTYYLTGLFPIRDCCSKRVKRLFLQRKGPHPSALPSALVWTLACTLAYALARSLAVPQRVAQRVPYEARYHRSIIRVRVCVCATFLVGSCSSIPGIYVLQYVPF